MSTPNLKTYVRGQTERRERQMQTAFPAKVLDWHSGPNTVRLEPQFIETWVRSDGTTEYEDAETTYIDNVPVLFPRSGSWSITFPIETGSFGLVVCTKYSLDAFRNQGNRVDPGDLRRFTMSGAVFHPVNLHPNSSALSSVDSAYMVLATDAANPKRIHRGEELQTAIKDALSDFRTAIGQITATGINHTTSQTNLATAITAADNAMTTALSKVKVE